MIRSSCTTDRGTSRASRWLLRPFLVAIGILVSSSADAANYYACDCRSGAEAGCVAGNDAAAGTSPATAWRSSDRLHDAVAASSCGDTFNFCSGGVFERTASGQDWTVANQNCSANPRIVRSYNPGSFKQRPKIVDGSTIFSLTNPGASGVTIRGLDIICTGACDSGVGAIFGDVDDVVLDDLLVDGFNVCVQWGANKRMGVRNSTIQNCKNQGLIGPAGSGSYVIDSRIIHNGCHEADSSSGCAFQHAHYWNVSGPEITDLTVRGNYYEDNTLAFGSGACDGNALVIRGGTRTVVEDNVVVTSSDGGGPTSFCQAVRMSTSQSQQECRNCAFRRNKILGGHILLGVESWTQGGIIENNLLYSAVSNDGAAKTGILLKGSANGAVDSNGVTIRNNSIVMGSGGGFPAAGIGVFKAMGTTPHRIAGNAIEMIGTNPADVCLRFIRDEVVPTIREDYNVCGRSNPNAHYAATGTEWSLTEWRANTIHADHSLEAGPGFTSPRPPLFDFTIGSSSPAVDAADPANSPATDILGAARPVGAAPDAGAYESGGAGSRPLAPILLP